MPAPNGMNGLLADPLFNIGMGLLQAGGRSLDPRAANPWGMGISQGLLAAQQNQAQQQQMELQRQRAEYMEMQMQQAQQAQYQAQAQNAQREAYIATRPPAEQKMLRALGDEGWKQLAQSVFAAPKETWGEPEIDNRTGKPMLVQRSSTGQLRSIGGGGVNITQEFGGKPDRTLTSEDAARLGVPESDKGNYLLTAEGGLKVKPRTAASAKVEEIESKAEYAASQAAPAVADYRAAVEEWKKNKSNPDAIARVTQERRRMGQILAQSRNPGRAPTDDDVKVAMADLPNPISLTEMYAAYAGGGDPFSTAMDVIEKELGVTGAPKAKAAQKPMTNEQRKLLEKYGLK